MKVNKNLFDKKRERGELPKIKEIVLPDTGSGFVIIKSDEDKSLYWYHEYLGDYGINWVIVWKDGDELERYNAKYIESIHWDKEDNDE